MSRRITIAVLAVLALTAFVGVTSSDATSVLPYQGKYRGEDAHHRTITFELTHSGEIVNFKVNHTPFPNARVQGSRWHHTCMNNLCTRGEWIYDFAVKGYWNNAASGGDVPFEANAIAF